MNPELASWACVSVDGADPPRRPIGGRHRLYMEPPGHDPFGYTACRTGDLLVRRMIWKRVVDSRRAQTCSVVDFSTEPTIASDLASVDRPVFEELWEAGQRIAVPLMSLPGIYAMLDGTCSAQMWQLLEGEFEASGDWYFGRVHVTMKIN